MLVDDTQVTYANVNKHIISLSVISLLFRLKWEIGKCFYYIKDMEYKVYLTAKIALNHFRT